MTDDDLGSKLAAKRGPASSNDAPQSKQSKNVAVEDGEPEKNITSENIVEKVLARSESKLVAANFEDNMEKNVISGNNAEKLVARSDLKRAASSAEDESSTKRSKIMKVETAVVQASLSGSITHMERLNDDLIQEILLHLPAKSVIRCRSVCKKWCDWIKEKFLEDHFQRQLAQPLLIYRDCETRLRVDSSDMQRCQNDGVFHYREVQGRESYWFRVRGSSDGLLLISYMGELFICNPCTRRWTQLPKLRAVGFYHSAGEFRVLSIRKEIGHITGRQFRESEFKFFIHSVTSHCDRRLDSPTSSKELKVFLDDKAEMLEDYSSALFNRSLHWWLPADRTIVAFCTVEEKFSLRKSPEVRARAWSPFIEINAKLGLGIFDKSVACLDVWVLDDYSLEKWSVAFRVKLEIPSWTLSDSQENDDEEEESPEEEEDVDVEDVDVESPVCLLSSGENLMLRYLDHFIHFCSTLDFKVKKVYHLPGNKTQLAPYLLKPSLIQHSFLDRRDSDNLPKLSLFRKAFRKGFPFFKFLAQGSRYDENAVTVSDHPSLAQVVNSILGNATWAHEMESGNASFKNGDCQNAIMHYTQAMKYSKVLTACAKRANAYYNARMYVECIHDCDMILEKRDDIDDNMLAKAMGTKGHALLQLSRSREDFDDAIELIHSASASAGSAELKAFLANQVALANKRKELFLSDPRFGVQGTSKVTSEHVLKELSLLDTSAKAPAEKRKAEDQDFTMDQEPIKRQRLWNEDPVNIPGKEVAKLTGSEAFRFAQRHSSGRSDRKGSRDSPKDRIVPPSQTAATTALRIDGFVRPFTLKAVQELLGITGSMCSFWMDHIRTHCYVTYSSVEEAVATRNAVYNLPWPPKNHNYLVAEFVDPQEVELKVEASQPPQANANQDLPHLAATLLPTPTRARTMDDLFRKTQTYPRIYYMPLSDEEVSAKLEAARNDGGRG